MKLKKGLAILGTLALLLGLAACQKSGANSTAQTGASGETLTVQVQKVDDSTVTAVQGELSAPAAPDGQAPDATAGATVDGKSKDGNENDEDKASENDVPDANASATTAQNGKGQGGQPSGGAPNSGEMPSMPDGEAPNSGEMPSMPNGEAPGSGEMPSMPDGEAPGSGEMPSMPDGEAPGSGEMPSMPGGMGGSVFTAGDTVVTFTLTDSTVITLEATGAAGTAGDITEGAVLEITLDKDNKALTVTVKSLNTGGNAGNFGGSEAVTNGTAAETITQDGDTADTVYASSGDDENALRVDGAAVTLTGITVEKTGGESSNTENGDFYGQNAGLLALSGAQVTIRNATVTTDAVNGNGIFSYGNGTTVNIYDTVIRTAQRNSGGIQTTGGGTTNAYDLDVQTKGASSAAIRTDRGGGTVNVNGGTYVTNGTGSPAIYSTAAVSVEAATLTANASEGIVVEGKNSVALKDCSVTANMSGTYAEENDENLHGIMIYQSMSGDADVGEAAFSMTDGSLTVKNGDMFYVTNTTCTIALSGVKLTGANDTLLRVEGNSGTRGWGTAGANGGDVIFTADGQTMAGQILVDDISSLSLSLTNGTAFSGCINPDGQAGSVSLTLDAASSFSLTQDCYVTAFTGSTDNIVSNGHHLYVNGTAVI